MAGFYDGRTYTQVNSIRELIELFTAKSNRSRTIFAHNGGRFDFLFIMQELEKTKRQVQLICQGARVTALKISLGDRHYVTLQDSFALLPHSLKKLCETFKPKHYKLDLPDYNNISKNNPIHQEYLKNDCLSLYEIIEKYTELPFIKETGIRYTLASTALAAWRSTLTAPIRTTPDFVQNFVRKSYAGGRCEIFKQTMQKGACFDVNSLYPSQMLKPLPIELIGISHDPFEFGFHDITVTVPDTYMPVLWVKTPKLVFPTGTFRGVYFSEEIKCAVRNGARIESHHGGFAFTKRDDCFSTYIRTLYNLRIKNPGTSLDLIAKLLLNSCYGKFCERSEKESMQKVNPNDPDTWPNEFKLFHSEKMFKKTGLVITKKTHRQAHMLAHIGSAITAYARVHMAENLYIPFQKEIAYTDTDSVFITRSVPTTPDLGGLKEEYKIKNAFFLLPKGYYIELENGEIIKKLKGFSKESLKIISRNSFINGNIIAKEKKLASLRTALIRENSYLAMVDQNKSVKTEYNKRKLLPGGDTRPWRLKEGKLI